MKKPVRKKAVGKKAARKKRRKNSPIYSSLEPRKMLASVGFDGAGQGSAELTYFLGDAPEELGQDLFESTIQDALKVWSDVADVTFTQTSQAGLSDSLDITFRNIDGEGGSLAQAFFPDDVNPNRIAGDIQFDSSEIWEVGNEQGTQAFDLLHVAVHEIGHALGLGHDDATNSVLFPTVSPNTTFDELEQVDIDSILELYAPAVQTPLVDTNPIDPVVPEGPVAEAPETPTPEVDAPESETPDGDEEDEEVPIDDEPEENDRQEEFRRRIQRFVNQWLRRLQRFGFRFRFR